MSCSLEQVIKFKLTRVLWVNISHTQQRIWVWTVNSNLMHRSVWWSKPAISYWDNCPEWNHIPPGLAKILIHAFITIIIAWTTAMHFMLDLTRAHLTNYSRLKCCCWINVKYLPGNCQVTVTESSLNKPRIKYEVINLSCKSQPGCRVQRYGACIPAVGTCNLYGWDVQRQLLQNRRNRRKYRWYDGSQLSP